MIVSLGSVRGSPGVTSWSVLLAAAWPGGSDQRRVVLEADPDGGVLGARYGFGVEPGAISLAASLRRSSLTDVVVEDHGRAVSSNVLAVPGPESPDRASLVWRDAARTTATVIAEDRDHLWFVDCGRFRPESPCHEFVARSSFTLLLTGAQTEDLVQVPSSLARLGNRAGEVGALVVGKPAHPCDEIAAFLGTQRLWIVPASRDLPGDVAAVFGSARGRRTWLWRTAVTVAEQIAATIDAQQSTVSVFEESAS